MTELTLATFAGRAGEGFTPVGAPEGTVWTLMSATPHDADADPATCRQFSLLFRGAAEPVFAQQIVPLHHPEIGEQAIFVVPVGRDEGGVTYQAVFN